MARTSRAPSPAPSRDALAAFSPAVRDWFRSSFEAPTDAQAQGWSAIAGGHHTLIHAPTGSGKTLAAFLWCLDRLATDPRPAPTRESPGSVRVLYVSPLKALTYDVERNLRAPLTGIAMAAERLGEPIPRISVASRTGDTPADDRREIARHPPDILITTPELLYLMLTSAAREALRAVEVVIVDEVHAIAGTKRGSHLALSLERLEALRARATNGSDGARLQRIGLSATQRPLEAIARFLGGVGPDRDVTIVDAGTRKALDLQVVVPVDDMAALGEVLPPDEQPGGPATRGDLRTSIWPAIHPRILELIRSHRSTIVFTNSRRLSERLAQRLNELAGEELVRAHHGSIAREQRLQIEEELKAGRLPALVATSSLELGIDMGAVDLVIQVESPTSVARGLQRVGRAGHQVGAPSKGVIFPKYRGDLLECAIVTRRMHEGAIETTQIPRVPLDVLAQQIVAMTVMDRWTVDDLLATLTRAAPYETLSREVLEGVLGMLAGAYPSDEFAELKPRVVWDRVTDTVEGRRDARVVAVTSGGTIPDRGLFGVFMVGEAGTPGRRVGELDEEMVYELRAGMHGDVVILGASSWRVEEISHDRVTVSPAPGVPGKLPFWKGDAIGRPMELGRAMGAFVRELEADLTRGERGRAAAGALLRETHDLDELAAENLLAYLDDEREATGALPTDRRIVVERFRDELGDWRLCLLTPFGGRIHAPWSLALEARIGERLGLEVQTIWSDDGIAIRLPEGDAPLDGIEALLFPDPDEVEDLVVGRLATSTLFASRFRENAGRALLLPRRRPGTRTPLWQQRQRAADLLAVASRYGSFPILVETYRECLSDVFDLPALREILGGVARREIAVHRVETVRASPFASSLLFDYVAAYMYEGDAPLAERRAGALTLDRDLLRELLGQEELRELLDPDALADLELSVQALTEDRRATTIDGVHDLLRRLGDLSAAEVAARTEGGAAVAGPWLDELAATRRAVRARIAGDDRWIAIEDVARYRDGVGIAPPVGVPAAFLGPGGRRPRRPACTVGTMPRPVPDIGAGGTLGPARRGGRGCARAVVGRRHDPARRVSPRRCRARMVRPGHPAHASAAVAGQAAARGRTGRPGGACPVPAGMARHHGDRGGNATDAGHGRVGAARRGRGSARRRPDPRLGPRAGRPAGADPGLPAAPPRRAGCSRRGRLGRAGEPRPGRRADRPGPARPRAAPPDRPAGRAAAAGRATTRGPPGASRVPGRVLLSRAVRCGGRRQRPRGAGCAVGPGLVRRGHQRHLRALAGTPLEADGREPWSTATARRTAERARSARSRGALVPGRSGRGLRHGTVPRPGAGPARAARRAHPRSGRRRRHRRRLRRCLSDPARDGRGGPDPARLLRRRPRGGAVRPGGSARSASRCARCRRPAIERSGSPAGCCRSGESIRCRAVVAAPRRNRSPAPPAGGGRLRRAGGRRGGALPRTRRRHPADAPGVGRPARRRSLRLGRLRALVADGRFRELVIRKVDGEEVAGSGFRPVLLDAGFVAGYRGLVLRAERSVSVR